MTNAIFRSDIGVKLIDSMGSDLGLARAAWVSTKGVEADAAELDQAKIDGLLGFLLKNRHGTPFEHGSMTFLVEAPIFVFREWHRHRVGWSYNEESGRYTQLKPVFYVPDAERNLQQVGKPGHYEFVPGDEGQLAIVRQTIRDSSIKSYDRYEHMLSRGIAKEVARMVLPVNTYSSMYATCNPRSLMSFLSLRTKSEDSLFKSFPQREIEMGAEKMEAEFARLFPVTHGAFVSAGRVSP